MPLHADDSLRPLVCHASVLAGWIGRLALTAACCCQLQQASAAENRAWELSPYRILATIACDDGPRPRPGLEALLAQAVGERVEGTLRPLWAMELETASDPAARRQCFELYEIPWDKLTTRQTGFDKLLWLGVRVVPQGYELSCREFDVYTRRWGPIRRRTVQQASFLPTACTAILKDAFSPLALIETLQDNDEQVQLRFKGSALPRRAGEESLVVAGEAYLPALRRTDRTGRLLDDGVLPVPWTYLTIAMPNDAGWLADIQSGVRRPFGVRRRGLVEQLAIGLRNPPGSTKVRFHARADQRQGLAGYEAFRTAANGQLERIGVTDRNGVITVPPGDEMVSMLLLRSDGQLLAKVPVPSGTSGVLQTPIADDVTRLQAQAEAQAVREELIDLVARRAIMMGRVKTMLKQGRVDDAKNLMSELDELPSPSAFGRTIDSAARRAPPSNDPTVQKRVDSLFAATRELLTKFLNTRPIIDLQNQVNAAATQQPEPGASAEPDD